MKEENEKKKKTSSPGQKGGGSLDFVLSNYESGKLFTQLFVIKDLRKVKLETMPLTDG